VEALGGLGAWGANDVRHVGAEHDAVASRELLPTLAFGGANAELHRSFQVESELDLIVIVQTEIGLGYESNPAEQGLDVPADEEIGERPEVVRLIEPTAGDVDEGRPARLRRASLRLPPHLIREGPLFGEKGVGAHTESLADPQHEREIRDDELVLDLRKAGDRKLYSFSEITKSQAAALTFLAKTRTEIECWILAQVRAEDGQTLISFAANILR
jgi:hypothetical protein